MTLPGVAPRWGCSASATFRYAGAAAIPALHERHRVHEEPLPPSAEVAQVALSLAHPENPRYGKVALVERSYASTPASTPAFFAIATATDPRASILCLSSATLRFFAEAAFTTSM